MRRPESPSFISALRAVLWSFIGIRGRRGYESDAGKLKPVHVIAVGVVAAAIFVLALLLIVRLVLA